MIVARGKDVLLLDAEGQRLKRRVLVFYDLCVETIVVLVETVSFVYNGPVLGRAASYKLENHAVEFVLRSPLLWQVHHQTFFGRSVHSSRL